MVNLSPKVNPTKYDRTESKDTKIEVVVWYRDWEIDWGADFGRDMYTMDDKDMVVVFVGPYNAFVTDDGVHFYDAVYRNTKMPVLEEFASDAISQLDDAGVIKSLDTEEKKLAQSGGDSNE